MQVDPAAFVVAIGTNDIRDPSARAARPAAVAAAVLESVVEHLKTRWPEAHVIVLALLPRAPRHFPITTTEAPWDKGRGQTLLHLSPHPEPFPSLQFHTITPISVKRCSR